MVAKSKRPQAERAAEWAMRMNFDCQHTRRAVKTQWQKQDFFAADVIGLWANGEKLWVQVTAGQTAAVLTRRRKLERYPWHKSDCVVVWQLVERQDVANPRRKAWMFRVWEYELQSDGSRKWTDQRAPITVPHNWFKAYKNDL